MFHNKADWYYVRLARRAGKDALSHTRDFRSDAVLVIAAIALAALLLAATGEDIEWESYWIALIAIGTVVAVVFLSELFRAPVLLEREAKAGSASMIARVAELEAVTESSLRLILKSDLTIATDGKTKTLTIRVINQGAKPANNCRLRLVTMYPRPPTTTTSKLIPATGSLFVWAHSQSKTTCSIGPKNWEHINFAWISKDFPNKWYPFLPDGQ